MSYKRTDSIPGKENLKSQLIYLISTSKTPLSRTDLSRQTGVSKMTISNHIADLIRMDLISEVPARVSSAKNLPGRKPTSLSISPASPCVCGIWLKRVGCQMILADISGHIIQKLHFDFPKDLTKEKLIHLLLSHYDTLTLHTKRRILGCGISSIGPIDTATGCLTTPPDFYGITDVPLVSILSKHTGLPTFLIHDAKAGGLAEKIYGYGTTLNDYVYCHISHGIGLGFIINGKLFSGATGHAGELGHTSIDCNGPRCSCGNVGCLELFSSVPRMQVRIQELLPFYKNSNLQNISAPSWEDILAQALAEDPVAVTALEDFCKYLVQALFNVLKLMDFSTLIVGYDVSPRYASIYSPFKKEASIIEKMLSSKFSHYNTHPPKILHSYFGGDAPLMGSIAVVANEVFEHNISLL